MEGGGLIVCLDCFIWITNFSLDLGQVGTVSGKDHMTGKTNLKQFIFVLLHIPNYITYYFLRLTSFSLSQTTFRRHYDRRRFAGWRRMIRTFALQLIQLAGKLHCETINHREKAQSTECGSLEGSVHSTANNILTIPAKPIGTH